MSSKTCFNSECNVSSSETWKKGWRLRNLDFADLCHRCGSIYHEGRFCEVFHKYASGWRSCETCGMRVHCGCIVSIHAFVVLDVGGIECMVCARKNVTLKQNQTCPPCTSPGWLMQPPVRNKIQNVGSSSNGFWHFGENMLNKSAGYFNSGSTMSFEVDMSTEFDRLLVSDRVAGSPPKRLQTQNLFLSNGSLKHNGLENTGYVRAAFNGEEQPCSCHMHPLHQPILKDGQCTQSGLAVSSPLTTQTDNIATVCSELSQQLKPQGTPGKQLGENSIVDSSHHSQLSSSVEMSVQKDLLAQYWPKTSAGVSQQISGSTYSIVTPLFDKRLSASDAGRLGRLVIPKKFAERHFPPISQLEGLPLEVQDIDGREWIFRFRFWLNNNSRIYVLEGFHYFLKSLKLQAGDTVSFSRREPEGKLILGFKKTSKGPQCDKGTLGVESENQTDQRCNAGYLTATVKDDLSSCHLKVNRATERSSLIAVKRKNIIMNSEKKHSRTANADFIGPGVTLEEAQRLFRSPLNHAPHVVVIEDFEFEEFEDAPVIGQPTIFVTDSSGITFQWTRCDNCLKWRKLPLDTLLPARFTCAENVWDLERSLCEAAEELNEKQLKALLYINNAEQSQAASSKKLQDAKLDANASEDLKALESLASEGCYEAVPASVQPTTKHPRHRKGCSCIVCCQSPSGWPKHEINCSCNVCKMLHRRAQTLLMRQGKNNFKGESVILENKSQVVAHPSKKLNPAVEVPCYENGRSCNVCCQSSSEGVKHQQNCSCFVCQTCQFHASNIQCETNQSKMESKIQESKWQVIAQSSETPSPAADFLENGSKGSLNVDRKVARASVKGQNDLYTQPEREQKASTCCNSMALAKMKQDASQRIVSPVKAP